MASSHRPSPNPTPRTSRLLSGVAASVGECAAATTGFEVRDAGEDVEARHPQLPRTLATSSPVVA